MTVATTECNVHRRVERDVREVPVTPLTVPVSVYRDGNCQRVTQVCLSSLNQMAFWHEFRVRAAGVSVSVYIH